MLRHRTLDIFNHVAANLLILEIYAPVYQATLDGREPLSAKAVKTMEIKINKVYERVTNLVFGAILLVLVLAMSIGVVKMFLNVWNIFQIPGVTGKYMDLITDVLTLFVLVEMSKSLVDYFDTHRLRMTFIVDAAIIFFIREIMIMAFQHKASPEEIYSFSALLLVLTILRFGSIFLFQRESKILAATVKLRSD